MARKKPFAFDETYHVYNRGVEKRTVFKNEADYSRMMILLLLCNSIKPVRLRNTLRKYQGRTLVKLREIFEYECPEEKIVDILAYCLMPNHFHIILHDKTEGGISRFLQKILTAYTMYFNKRYERTGVLFEGRSKSQHIADDAYELQVFEYVHSNPIALVDPSWKETGIITDKKSVRKFMETYPYCSYRDGVNNRPEGSILSKDCIPDFKTPRN
jgi:putative transposase